MTVQKYEGEELTPPSSINGAPSIPSRSDEKQANDNRYILQQIAKYKSGDRTQTTYKVSKGVWAAVNSQLLRDDKLHFDYFPSIETLVVRMPTSIHEKFSRRLSEHINEQLHLLSLGSGSAAEFAKDIRDVGSTTVRPLDPEYGTHDPDDSFQHLKSRSATVIFEVAHSQTGKKLRTLAEDYILGSDLEIRVMVGFDLEYKKSKKATFSVWRPSVQNLDGDEVWTVESAPANQVFRYDDGKPNLDRDAGVHLRLEEFADQTTCRQFEDVDRDVFISCSDLYQYLEEAEAIAKRAESTKLVLNPGLKKRRRTPSPEEQLDDDDENAFAESEERAAKRRDLDDSSYRGSSSDGT